MLMAIGLLVFAPTLLKQTEPIYQQAAVSPSPSSSPSIAMGSPQPSTPPFPKDGPNTQAQKCMPNPSETSDTLPSLPSTEPKESLSQLTLFLFGGGLAIFIALLAWSDQIRGIDKDTKELEQRFLEHTGIEKRHFLRIVKPESPDDRGLALTEVLTAGRIKSRDSAEVLRIFTTWNREWSRIVCLSAWKYYLTITLALVFFLAGIGSLFTDPTRQVPLIFITARVEMVILVIPAIVVASLLVILVCIAVRENALRSLLNSVSDMV
jgi:hypothetical protein